MQQGTTSSTWCLRMWGKATIKVKARQETIAGVKLPKFEPVVQLMNTDLTGLASPRGTTESPLQICIHEGSRGARGARIAADIVSDLGRGDQDNKPKSERSRECRRTETGEHHHLHQDRA
jgi:hypothetical protein